MYMIYEKFTFLYIKRITVPIVFLSINSGIVGLEDVIKLKMYV